MADAFVVRDMRKKDAYRIDDAYLNGYAKICGLAATAVYNSLSRHSDFNTQEAFPSIKKIAEQHGITTRTVIRAIGILERHQIVHVIRRKDEKTKRQETNVYVLLDKSEWSRVTPGQSEPGDKNDASRVTKTTESRVTPGQRKDTQSGRIHIEGDNESILNSESWRSVRERIGSTTRV